MSARLRTLGLSRLTAGMAAAICAATPCFAADSVGALLACRSIEASAARLACFDRESAALAAQRGSAPPRSTAELRGSDEPRAALNSRETFGLAPMEVAARAEAAAHAPKPLDSMTARIASVGKAADGREIFTLDNHQVWVQMIDDGNWLDARTGEEVTVSRGWLGSYWLRLPSHSGFKVTRIR